MIIHVSFNACYIYIYIHIDTPAYGSQTMCGSAIFRVGQPLFQANIQRSRKLVGQIARSAAGDRRSGAA